MIRYLLGLDGDVPEIYGLYQNSTPARREGCTYIRGDICDRSRIAALVNRTSPDTILHLAGLNRGSLQNLTRINLLGTENLLHAVVQEGGHARLLVIGSAAEYGYAGTKPISESTPLCPVSDYGISKVAQDLLTQRYHAAYALPAVVARPFNLVGPGQPESFVCGRMVAEAGEIESGRRRVMELVSLSARRDFIDVRDAVKAYWAIVSHDRFDEECAGRAFNVGSGLDYSVADLLSCIEAITGRRYEIALPPSPPPELIPTQICDSSLLHNVTGWRPSIPLHRSLQDMLRLVQGGVVS